MNIVNGYWLLWKLYLDDLEVSDCYGGNFGITLGTGVTEASAPVLSLPVTSWLGDDEDLETAFATESGGNLSAEVWRSDTLDRSGSGHVLTIDLLVGDSAVLADQVIQSMGGSLIMVDNMDMKWFATQPDPISRLEVFPNPARESIRIKHPEPDRLRVRLINPLGHSAIGKRPDVGGRISLEGIAPGLWILEVYDPPTQRRETTRLVVR